MRSWSLYAFLAGGALILFTAFGYYPRWKKGGTEATLSWDVSGYYLYLPAALIYKDLKQVAFFSETEQKYNPGPGMGQVFRHEASGNFVMKYSCGQALQFLPWFAAAHAVAPVLGAPRDGFSQPYQAAVSWGSLLVALIGLWYARKSLLVYFSEKAAALALLGIVAGTNYLNYTAIDGAMTHNWLFTVYALLVWNTIQFYRRPAPLRAMLIGLLCGWAALTRPTEAIAVLIPLLWPAGRPKWAFFKQNWVCFVLAAVVMAAVGMIQPVYWKWATGEWIVYSYQDQGFSWLHPHLKEILFSYRAGWLTYSPLMFLALAGIGPLVRQQRAVALPVLVFVAVFLYVASAWDIWWYGGSLGSRALVQSYALWLFPLAAFAQWALQRRWRQWTFGILALWMAAHNLWWTHQAHEGGLFVAEQMNKYYFWKVYGRSKAERDWLKLLDNKDEYRIASPKGMEVLYQNDFESDTVQITTDQPLQGARSLRMDATHPYAPEHVIPLQPGRFDALRVSIAFRNIPREPRWWNMAQMIVRFRQGDQLVKERQIRLQRHCDGEEKRDIYMDVLTPRQPFDRAEVTFWNADSGTTLWIDQLKVEGFHSK